MVQTKPDASNDNREARDGAKRSADRQQDFVGPGRMPLPAWLEPAVSESRRERNRDRKVIDLLAMTAQVVAKNGYYNMTLEEIAENLDVAKASVYHYFEGKEPLVLATLSACATYANDQLGAVARAEGSATDRLRALIRRHLTMITTEAPEISRLFLVQLEWPPQIAEAIVGWQREHDDFFRQVIRAGIDSGEFQVRNPTIARLCIQGGMGNVPVWFRRHGDDRADSEILDEVIETLMGLVGVHEAPYGPSAD